ncbi:MAG: polyprenyl diphosphate synthase [Patescibacteria group bacterium]
MKQKSLNHIAIIPDGNRRWAKQRGLPTFEGHRRGFEVVRKVLNRIWETDINTVTFWALSTENLGRSEEELKYLMKLFEKIIIDYLKDAIKKEIKITHLGRKDRIPKSLLAKIIECEEKTKDYKTKHLNIALDYGGRDETIRAIKKIKEQSEVDEVNFNDVLDTKGQPYPYPDLIIRTGGDRRTSGFMIWQSAYSEYFFLDKYLPDMTVEDLDNIINDFLKRERRFGK